ncbi:hypothetical protein C7477_107162 [Phyllobacterium leguminum]|uniref:Uncharacterized protein n=1 Tax=Phyllobacterium leguminum TaxID=314237 RepID=A0A318T6F8_9HYPH|nr:hypothetical protein C7477_107162 [Phyllobacterium leguminum]
MAQSKRIVADVAGDMKKGGSMAARVTHLQFGSSGAIGGYVRRVDFAFSVPRVIISLQM